MAIRTYDILLDSYNSTIPEPIVGRQGDKNGAVTLHVTITDRGTAVDLTGQTVNLIAKTANDTAVVADNAGVTLTDAANGRFDYAIPNALWSESGKIKKAYFSLNTADGQQTTYDLIFIVKKSIDINQKRADDYVTIIDGTLRDLQSKVNAINEAYKNGEFYSKSESDEKYQKEIENYSTNNPHQFKALISSFGGPNFNSLDLYWTNDFFRFQPINKTSIDELGTLRDPQIAYFDNKYWLAYTWGTAWTTDFIHFTKVPLPKIGDGNNWGPEWVVDGNHVYLTGVHGTIETWGSTADFRIWYCEFDVANQKFGQWKQLDYANPTGVWTNIDASIIKYNNKWVMAMKDEYHYGQPDYFPITRVYTSDSAMGPYAYSGTIPFSDKVEGMALAIVDGILVCFADGFNSYSSWRMESTDGITWKNENNVSSVDGSRTQHFAVFQVTTSEQERTIQKAIDYYKNGTLASGTANLRTSAPRIELKAGVNDLYPQQGIEYHYRVTDSLPAATRVEVNLHMDKNRGYSKILFEIERADGTCILRLNKTDAFLPPQGASFWEMSRYNAPVVLVTPGSDNYWDSSKTSEPYRIVSAPVDTRGGRNLAIGTRIPFTVTADGTTGYVAKYWSLPEEMQDLAPANTPMRISLTVEISNADNGSIGFGIVAGDGKGDGSWKYYPISSSLKNGKQHITQLVRFDRNFVYGDRLVMTINSSKATYVVSNLMFEVGTDEHVHSAAAEDDQWAVRALQDEDLNKLESDGKWILGRSIHNNNNLPATIKGQWRAGMVQQIDSGAGVKFQYITTNQSEIFFRGWDVVGGWGGWTRINATIV